VDVKAQQTWTRVGAIASLALALAFTLLRRWKTARLFARLGAACAVEWRDTRISREVGTLLARARRDA
jgi:hypothetical protein